MTAEAPGNPFKGLKPFDKGEPLFGRDADLLLMRDRMFRARTTLLFAGSGVGKTSFFRAKFIPDIERRYKDEFRVSYQNEWAAKDPLAALKTTLGADSTESLSNFFRRENLAGGHTAVVVLDQFEELFQHHVYLPYFPAFRDELCEAISASDVPVRFILAMREEFLGHLSAFDNRVPDLFANYYRLKNPDKIQAEEIIGLTCETAGAGVDDAGLKALLEDLMAVEVRGGGRKTELVQRDFVILPHLQLVCRGLWESATSQAETLDGKFCFLSDYANRPRSGKRNPARKMLEDFCATRMQDLTADQQSIAARAFDYLVTNQGAKMAYELKSLARHMKADQKLLEKTLEKLSRDTRILRETQWQNERWFELYHDMYAPIMYDWKARFESRERRNQELEKQASDYDRWAVQSEAQENRDEALMLLLKALDVRETELRRRQAARLLTGLEALAMTFRHEGAVTALALAADCKQVVTASAISMPDPAMGTGDSSPEQSLVQVWDAATGAPYGRPLELQGRVAKLAMASGGTLAAATDEHVYIIDNLAGSVVRKINIVLDPRRSRAPAGMRFTQDQEFILLEFWVGPGWAWGCVPVKGPRSPLWHSAKALRLAFDAAGKIVAAADPRRVNVLDARTSEPVIPPIAVPLGITAVSLSADGKLLATGSRNGAVRLWQTATGTAEPHEIKHSGPVRRLAFKDDGRTILAVYREGPVGPGAPNAQFLLQSWDANTARPRGPAVFLPSRDSLFPQFSPKANYVTRTAGLAHELAIWDTDSGEARVAPWARQPRTRAEWAANDRFVLAGGPSGTARLWRTGALGRLPSGLTHKSGVTAARLSPDGSRVAIVAVDGTVAVLAEDGSTLFERAAASAKSAAWSPDGKMLAIADHETVGLVDVAGKEMRSLNVPDVEGLMFSPKGRALAILCAENMLRWWVFGANVRRPRAVHSGKAIRFSREGRFFVSYSSEGGHVKIWNSVTGEVAGRFRHSGSIRTLSISPDGRYVLNSSEDGKTIIWKTPDGILAKELPHQGHVAAAAFSTTSQYAATLGTDQVLRLWSAIEWEEVARIRYEGTVRKLAFSHDETALMLASAFWVHLFRVPDLEPMSSRQLSGRWTGEYRYDQTAQSMIALTAPSHMNYRVEKLRFDEVEPGTTKLPIGDWDRRLALRFEGEEVVPAALARAAKPAPVRPGIGESKVALKEAEAAL